MLKVKICGITNYDDALCATNLGADYLGFQLIKESAKKVSEKMLQEVNEKLPPFVLAVAIFQDQDQKTITKTELQQNTTWNLGVYIKSVVKEESLKMRKYF